MNFSTLETILIATCIAVSIAAFGSFFRAHRTHLSIEDFEMLKSMIRMEVAETLTDAKQEELLDELQEKYLPEWKKLQ